jgi:2-methylcitrate dehydratase
VSSFVELSRHENQALGIGRYAVDFMAGDLGPGPSPVVLDRTRLFHTDAALCAYSALARRTNAPTLLREEALSAGRPGGPTVFGDPRGVWPEKAVVANSAAMREWDSNGTNFGHNPARGHSAGEFGHNDFYSVPVAAAQERGLDGATALLGMVLVDEIRGRLAEVFSLKTYKIDHVLHGAIASAATYGSLTGATPEQIEMAIGMTVAHYVPWRAIRAGKQLSDSKGSSAALSAEAAVLSMRRAQNGFLGPRDIFRNPEALFRRFEPTRGASPFDLFLAHSGDDFAVMGMHFKLGLYEHQSAGALHAIAELLSAYPHLADPEAIVAVRVTAYEPAFGIIGDEAKRDPRTRQSADHSMVYIVARTLRKAIEIGPAGLARSTDGLWKQLMLTPDDYGRAALNDAATRRIMERITFAHGGERYDSGYPEGIPTSVQITDSAGHELDSGMVMYPAGHARNREANLTAILDAKFDMLERQASTGGVGALRAHLDRLPHMSAEELRGIYAPAYVLGEPVD